MKRIAFILFVNLLASTLLAQQADEMFTTYAKQKVDELQDYIRLISNREVSQKEKDLYYTKALQLFIGEGKEYVYIDDNGNEQTHAPVTIKTSSARRTSSRTITSYLQNLKRGALQNSKMTIVSVDIVYIDNLFQIGNGRYKASAHYRHNYYNNKDGRVLYQDVTEKKLEIILEKLNEVDINVPIVLLSNISAIFE